MGRSVARRPGVSASTREGESVKLLVGASVEAGTGITTNAGAPVASVGSRIGEAGTGVTTNAGELEVSAGGRDVGGFGVATGSMVGPPSPLQMGFPSAAQVTPFISRPEQKLTESTVQLGISLGHPFPSQHEQSSKVADAHDTYPSQITSLLSKTLLSQPLS